MPSAIYRPSEPTDRISVHGTPVRRCMVGGYIILYWWNPTTLNREQSKEHRMIWQEHHGPIPSGHVIHHKNGIKSDNRIENLECLSNGSHISNHHPGTNCPAYSRETRLQVRKKSYLKLKSDPIKWRKHLDTINRSKIRSRAKIYADPILHAEWCKDRRNSERERRARIKHQYQLQLLVRPPGQQ
jgi:hypothetical protein